MELEKKILLTAQEYQVNILKCIYDHKKLQCYCDLCNYVKNISHYFYRTEDDQIRPNYNLLLYYLYDAADLLPFKYIIHNQPKISKTDNVKSIEDVLDKLVKEVRNEINGYNTNNDLKGQCSQAASIAMELAENYSLQYYPIKLYPGFSLEPDVCKGCLQHYFGIISYEDKKYLVDCSYSQFFLLKRCVIDRVGLMEFAGASVGLYMKMDSFREKVAKKILKDGWIELAPGVLKAYLDGFALSYRNGLYYEQTDDFSYTTTYTDENYWHFINGEDNQFNYEKPLTLGFQSRPLKNPAMIFNKR